MSQNKNTATTRSRINGIAIGEPLCLVIGSPALAGVRVAIWVALNEKSKNNF